MEPASRPSGGPGTGFAVLLVQPVGQFDGEIDAFLDLADGDRVRAIA